MSRVWCAVALCCFVSVCTAVVQPPYCNETIAPTFNLDTEILTITTTYTTAEPVYVCLVAGHYEGCGGANLETVGGGPLRFFGQGALTDISCFNQPFGSFTTGGWLKSVRFGAWTQDYLVGVAGSADDVVIEDVVMDNSEDISAASGVVANTDSKVSIIDSTFRNCSRSTYGGAVYAEGTLTVVRCTFDRNYAEAPGADIFTPSTAELLTIINSTFTNSTSLGFNGGGCVEARSGVNVSGSYFEGCRALEGYGGGVNSEGGDFIVSSSTFYNCYAWGGGGGLIGYLGALASLTSVDVVGCDSGEYEAGGTMIVDFDFVDISDCHYANNTAVGSTTSSYAGGLFVKHFNTLVAAITRTRFIGNEIAGTGGVGGDGGGGLFLESVLTLTASVVVVDCEFVSNTARDGAGSALFANTPVTITGSTFALNKALENAADTVAIYGVLDIVVDGCLFTDNDANGGTELAADGQTLSVTNTNFVRATNSDIVITPNDMTSIVLSSCTIDECDGVFVFDLACEADGTANVSDLTITDSGFSTLLSAGSCDLTLTNYTAHRNTGTGLSVVGGSAVIERASVLSGGYAILADTEDMTITDSVFNGTAYTAIESCDSYTTVLRSTFYACGSSSSDGGAIQSTGTLFVGDGCHFVDNTASNGGAISSLFSTFTELTVVGSDCVFDGNSAVGNGGTFNVVGGEATFGNVTATRSGCGLFGGVLRTDVNSVVAVSHAASYDSFAGAGPTWSVSGTYNVRNLTTIQDYAPQAINMAGVLLGGPVSVGTAIEVTAVDTIGGVGGGGVLVWNGQGANLAAIRPFGSNTFAGVALLNAVGVDVYVEDAVAVGSDGKTGLGCSTGCNVTNVVIRSSRASGTGGCHTCQLGVCNIDNFDFSECTAPTGGAVFVEATSVAALSSGTISASIAESAGGAALVDGIATFSGVTFTGNTAVSGGVVSATGAGATVTLRNCNVTGNSGSAAGAALICVSEASCSAFGTLFKDNNGPTAAYALFLAELHFTDCAFVGHEDGIAAYGASNVTLHNVTLFDNSGTAVSLISSPASLLGVSITSNSGQQALLLSAARDVSVRDSFISSNSGTGFVCAAPKQGFSVTLIDSVVCDNGLDYDCNDDCNVVGGCGAVNTTTCDDYCVSNSQFCVTESGVAFGGPYGRCPVCDGDCDDGTSDCPDFTICLDTAGGGYECACPTGFAGNGSQPCSDADECALGTDNCSPLANCTNTPGSFTCTCESGYTGTGITCKDIDECGGGSHDCVVNAVCTNVAGSYVCECDDTSYGDGRVECTPCPANSHSFVGATNVTDCECDTNNFNIDNEIGSACGPCPAGSYVTDAGGVLVCIECPADSYSDSPNTGGACTACPTSTTTNGGVGATSVANCSCAEGLTLVVIGGANGTAQCERYCPAGTSRPDSDSQCIDCPIGRFSDQPNQEECLPCPLNSLTAGVASTSVTNCSCQSGYFAPGGAVGVDCEKWCAAGSYRPAPFGIDCPVCDIGSYSDEPNAGECSPCPANAVTPAVNSTAITVCECPPNYYTPERKRGTECQPCPSGAKCKGGVSWPVARKGYIYVEDEDGTAGFAECVPFEACAGNGQCADGYTGDLCERCKPNFYRLDGLCYECQNNAWLIVLACGLGLFLFCAVLVWFNSQDRAINKFASMVIGVNALQIAGMYGRLNLNWPPLAQKFFAVLSLVNFNIELVSPECAVSVNDPFVLRWLMTMFFPVLVISIFASVAGIGSLLMMVGCCGYDPAVSKWNPRYLRHTCIRAFYQVMTIGYLPMSAAVFEFFYCVKDASGDMVISTARQTKCYTPTYWGLFPVALLCFGLYPVGVPLFCGFLLKTKRVKLGEIKFSLRYGFLVGRFDPVYYYFELAVMARKLGIAAAMSFLTDNAYVRAAGAIVVLAVCFTVQLRFTPYRTRLYNILENLCLAISTQVLVVSVMFQAGDAEELTRTIFVVLLLCALLVVITAGLILDALAVLRSEREAEAAATGATMYDETADEADADFDDVAAIATVATFSGRPPQQPAKSVELSSRTSGGLEDVATVKTDGSEGDGNTSNPVWTGDSVGMSTAVSSVQ